MAVHWAGKVRQSIRGKNLFTLYSLVLNISGSSCCERWKEIYLLRSSGELIVVIE